MKNCGSCGLKAGAVAHLMDRMRLPLARSPILIDEIGDALFADRLRPDRRTQRSSCELASEIRIGADRLEERERAERRSRHMPASPRP